MYPKLHLVCMQNEQFLIFFNNVFALTELMSFDFLPICSSVSVTEGYDFNTASRAS